MPEAIEHTLPIRAVNSIGALLRRASIDPLPLDPEVWKARACAEAGLDDLDSDPQLEEGLSIFARAVREEAHLSTLGRFGVREHVQNALVTRLRRVALRKAGALSEPAAKLNRPIIIVGLPRCGTSFLHRLLAAQDNHRAIPLWQVTRPNPGPGKDSRRSTTARNIALMKKVAPALDRKHHMTADTSEECNFLLSQTMCSTLFWVIAPVYSYVDWLMEQDMRQAYQAYREQLMLLQRTYPGTRLILKAPMHNSYVQELSEIIPEACIVQTHRDPVPITLSNCSLTYTLQTAVTEQIDQRRLIDKNVELLLNDVRCNLAGRAKIPAGRVLDLQYEDFIKDPAGTIQQLHDHFSLPYTADDQERVRQEIASRPQHRFGKHVYSADDLGLDPEKLREAYTPYIERFRAAYS